MYKIIGADGKEYGPITADQLRQWVAEGRANAQTKILPDGATEWRSLSEFPELLGGMAGSPPSMQGLPSPGVFPAMGMAPAAIDQVSGPAIGLIVVAVLGFLLQAFALVWKLGLSAVAASQMQMERDMPSWAGMMFSGTLTIISAVIGIVVAGLILFGGIKMRKLENYGLAMACSIIAMIPCISPCCLIGLPIGIWAVVVLSKPEVKNAFR